MKKLSSRLFMVSLILFLYIPILSLIVFSFNANDSRVAWGGFSLRWYQSLFADSSIMVALLNTIIIAIISSIVYTILGSLAAIGINNLKKNARSAIMTVTYIPIINPEIIMGVSLMLLFKVFMRYIPFQFGYVTLILSHIAFCVPYVIYNVLPKLRQMNPNLIEAAYDLGCNSRQAFFKVVIPEIFPGVLSGFIMAVTYSIDDFVVSYFNSGSSVSTLPIAIESMTKRNMDPSINALSTIIFVVILVILVVKNILDNRRLRRINHTTQIKKSYYVVAMCALLAVTIAGGCLVSSLNKGPELILDTEMLSEYDYTKFKDEKITINVANWGEYMSLGEDEMIHVNEQFQALTGIKVNYVTYANNEGLYAKLKSGGADYDIVIPSDYMISKLINEDMLEKLDFKNIPNYETQIMDTFKNPLYDPQNEYSVPYTWGMVCLVYNKDLVTEAPTSWSALWDEQYDDQILMFNNPRDAFGIAEIMLGYSLNTENEDEIDDAFDLLRDQYNSGIVQAYVMDEVFDKMEGGSAAIAPYYVGDAISMIDSNPDLDYVIPQEGTNQFVDAICIPKGARNKEAAEMYINFLCETEIALANCEYIGYSTPHEEVFELLPDDVKSDERRYPSDDFILNKTETFLSLSDEASRQMQDCWNAIRLSNDGEDTFMSVSFAVLIVAALVFAIFNIINKMRKNQ
ncbi:MAG: extracellular solute-binding protein [Clostridia bacterium]|nr:extracellular solute-binding protein [Clostridia bacterium]